FGQATAYPAPNLSQCGNEVFNLTVQTPIILGNQPAGQFTVGYFLSQADATANVNPIANPSSFISPPTLVVYARVDNTGDGSFAVTSFSISWFPTLQPMPDIVACSSYTLPELLVGQYSSAPNGGGIILPPGTILTASQTVFLFDVNGSCASDESFIVTIVNTPIVPDFPDVATCNNYVLPVLPPGMTYHSAPGGNFSTLIPASYVITSSTQVYVFGQSGTVPNCTSESSFMVTIYSSPPPVLPSRISRCVSYELSVLPTNYHYYTSANGTGTEIAAGTTITQSETIHVYATSESGIACNIDFPVSIEIGVPQITPVTYEVLDCDGDGFATFDLGSKIPEILDGLTDVAVTFHESLFDAQMGTNAVISPYNNIIPGNISLWVRSMNTLDGCYTIFQTQLTVLQCANIAGVVRIDTDGNGCSQTDPPAGGIEVVCTHGNSIFYSYTNAQGEYEFTNIPQGVSTVYVSTGAQINFGAATPTAHTFNLSGPGNYTQDFCITPAAPVSDASVSILANIPARPGMMASYYLAVQNNGNTVLDGSATLNYYAPVETFATSNPFPSASTANTLTFNFTGLQPYAVQYYFIQFNIASPPTVNAGNILQYSATVNTTQTDANPDNNEAVLNQFVVNSYDPNDMAVSPGSYILQSQVQDDLTYMINFQNLGTADAINVRIENTLDQKLDWSTFRPVTASHGFAVQRDGDHVVFRFNNINLPAESEDEPASHGFIIYKVKPISNMAIDDIILTTLIFILISIHR
ncbi:MAG: hypothetical protein EOO48_02780, partial [Flavobacterium sp.]